MIKYPYQACPIDWLRLNIIKIWKIAPENIKGQIQKF